MRSRLTYKGLMKQHLEILRKLQTESGLFLASRKGVRTGYDKSWLRDNFYECLAFEVIGDWDTVEKTYNAILEVFLKHEDKITHAIGEKPEHSYQYIHARYHPMTFEEFWEEWGNKQNDNVGAILFNIGRLENHHKRSILKDKDFIRIVNKLVKYLENIEYWHDRDSGMWEEDEEIHASSVGAVVAGLKEISKLPRVKVPKQLIKDGEEALRKLLPRESGRKFVDLALLSLIWPYNVVTPREKKAILENVEYHLLRRMGVIRYKGDHYYNRNPDGFSEEAEWTFGLSWLAIIYEKMRNDKRSKFFLDKMLVTDTKRGVPELYFSNSKRYNANNPLGWSESLFIVALHEMNRMLMKGR
jgi:phosphorylase kinase alpha/beta subunit